MTQILIRYFFGRNLVAIDKLKSFFFLFSGSADEVKSNAPKRQQTVSRAPAGSMWQLEWQKILDISARN